MRDTDWSVVLAAKAANDLAQIEDHVIRAYCALGESLSEAMQRAEDRIEAIITDAEPSMPTGVRHSTF